MINEKRLDKVFLRRSEPVDWDAVFNDELPHVFNYFRFHGMDVEEAEDLTATTFEKAWRSRSSFRSNRARVQTWIMSIARHSLVDFFRHRKGNVSVLVMADHQLENLGVEGPAPAIEQEEAHSHLRHLLVRLPEREREIVALKYGAEMTNRAIAQVTGLSESNVGTILHRVVSFLRTQMEEIT
jgi:RNA polymerase sigma-70 factor (ECF subfamily)